MIDVYAKNVDGVWFGLACDIEGRMVFATNFAFNEKIALKGLLTSVPFGVPVQWSDKASTSAEHVIVLLKDIYDGKDVSVNISLSMDHLSKYTQRILKTVVMIPVGYVSSYGAIASVGGGSPRAVGRVMALNPFAPVVPCHRVVSSDFTLGGYGGGLDVKFEFLKRERRGHTSRKEIPINGKKFRVYPVESLLRTLAKE